MLGRLRPDVAFRVTFCVLAKTNHGPVDFGVLDALRLKRRRFQPPSVQYNLVGLSWKQLRFFINDASAWQLQRRYNFGHAQPKYRRKPHLRSAQNVP
ncbi:MAG: hypothetical protein ACI9RO_000818 [Alteromonas macleodii]|jgi:hypothetical protein